MDVRMQVLTWPSDAPRGAVSRFCREHGLSRSRFYELRALGAEQGVTAAFSGRPRGPRPRPEARELEEAAVAIRKDLTDRGLDAGPVTVRDKLLIAGLPAPSTATLARWFLRRGLVVPEPRKRPRSSYRRFTFEWVHQCWQIDALEWRLADQTKVVIFQVLDDHSRVLISSLVASSENSEAAIRVMDKGIKRYQVPQFVLSDNGTALNPIRRGYKGQLYIHLTQLGVKMITSKPAHPQTQGKNERAHQPLQKWLNARPPAETMAELQTIVDDFDDYYNHHRGHQALGKTDLGIMRTPNQALTEDAAAWPPEPLPEPPTPDPEPTPKIRRAKVGKDGQATINYKHIQLGTRHANTTITAIINGDTITTFTPEGTLIRTVQTRPEELYYGIGRPAKAE